MPYPELKKIAAHSNRYNYLGKLIEGFALFLITIVLTRKLTIHDFGTYNLLMETLKIVALLGSLGIANVFLRYLPEFLENKAEGNIAQLLRIGFLIHSAALVALLAILYALRQPLSIWLKIPNLSHLLLVFFGVLFTYALVTTCNQAANGLLLQRQSNLFNAGAAALKLLLFFYVLARGLGIQGILWSIFSVNVIQLFAYFKLLFTYRREKCVREKLDHRRMMRFGFFSYFNDSSASLFEVSVDIYIIGIFLTPEHVALYSFAALTVPLLMNWFPTRVSGNLLLPLFVRQMERTGNDANEINYLYQLIIKVLAFFAIPTVLGMMALAPEMIRLIFSDKFLPGLHVFFIFASFAIVNEILAQASLIATLKERTDIISYSQIFSIYNLIMDLYLVGPYGIEGVAFATGTALLGKGIFIHLWVKRITPFSLPYQSLGKIFFYSLMMLAFLFTWKHFCPIANIFLLLFAILTSAGVYFFFAQRFKIFSTRDRDILSALTGKFFFPF